MFRFFGRRVARDEAWDGVVTGRKRSSPDGQNIYHRITVTLGDGSTRDVRVRGSLWKTLAVGDRVTKRAGDKAPVKVAQETTE